MRHLDLKALRPSSSLEKKKASIVRNESETPRDAPSSRVSECWLPLEDEEAHVPSTSLLDRVPWNHRGVDIVLAAVYTVIDPTVTL